MRRARPEPLTLFVGEKSEAVSEVGGAWDGVVAVREGRLDPETWMLVRLDGYLAAAGALDDGAPMDSWLGRWFVRPRVGNQGYGAMRLATPAEKRA